MVVKKAKKKPADWIGAALGKNRGALHRALHVPLGQKIPISKLKAAAKKPGKLGARARVVVTVEKINSKRKKKGK